MSSASNTAPHSVVADPTTLARKVADIRAAGPTKLQAGTPSVLKYCLIDFWLAWYVESWVRES